MTVKKISGVPEKIEAGREKGLNPSGRSILQKSLERHDKVLKILSRR